MAVSFTPRFTENDIRNFIKKKIAVIESVVKDQLIDVAEQFVADARSKTKAEGGFGDVTSNLRGSIGYTLVKDGVEIFGNFEGTGEGQGTARRLAKGVQADYPKGFSLIVVAGMNYAIFVESRGYDVITGSSQLAEGNLKRQFDRLKQQLSKVR